MKSKAFYLSLILLMTAIALRCNIHHVKEIFKVTRDTIHVNIDGKLDEALLVNNKYYTFFEIRDSMKGFALKFYIIKKNGEVEKQIELPEEVSSNYYYRLYYWHNQIIVKNTEYNISSYFLDEAKGIFVNVGKNLEIPVFEDEKYQITAACRGEFGSTIYFKNKLTGYVNSSPSGCPFLINKIGDRYFLNAKGNPYFAGIETNSASTLSPQVFFRNNDFKSNFYIATSFIAERKLYHIWNSWSYPFGPDEKKEKIVEIQDSAKIGTISKGVFTPIYTFKDRFNIQFAQQLSPDYQICTFHTEQRRQIGFKKDIPPYREGKYGVIEIKDNEIKIHYFISEKAG